MSKTIKISSGDLFVNENTGKMTYIKGPDKLAQDLVEEFMSEYDPETGRGTKIRQLKNVALIRQEVAETVDRIKLRQRSNTAIDSTEQIDEITQLIVRTYNGTDVIFLVQVSTVAKDKSQISAIIRQGGDLVQVDHQLLP